MICTGDHVVQGRLGVNTYAPDASIHVKDHTPSVMLEEATTGTVAAIGLEQGELMVSGASLVSVMGADFRVEGGNLVVNSIDVTATLENLPREMAREIAKQSGADLSAPVAETVQGLELARGEIGALGESIEGIHGNLTEMISRLTVLELEHDRIVFNTNLQESVRGLKGVMDGITMANEEIRRRFEALQSKVLVESETAVEGLTTVNEEIGHRVGELESKILDVHAESRTAIREMDDRLAEALDNHKGNQSDRVESLEPRINFLETSVLITTAGNQATRASCEELACQLEDIGSRHEQLETRLDHVDNTMQELCDKVLELERQPLPVPAPVLPPALIDGLRSEVDDVKKTLNGVSESFGSLSESFMALNAERGMVQKNINELERSVTRRMEKGLENVVAMTGYQGKTMQSKMASLTEKYAFSGPMQGMFALGASSMGLRVDLGSNVISSQKNGSVFFRVRFVEPPIVLLTIHGHPDQQVAHAMTTVISTRSFSWRATPAETPEGTVLSWLAIGK
jgi:Pyruvate/2-oxoacid:ferredoxin oxidoreductase gamma subunit/uncharacterized coiled-coil protein SlyX